MEKVYSLSTIEKQVEKWRSESKKIVFTNGCFDILHRGHVESLQIAKGYGDILVVGLNSDRSVRSVKGKNRPFVGEEDRAYMLAQLIFVDAICIFDDDTPMELMKIVQPDILAKGGDYTLDGVVGRDFVEQSGGKVVTVSLIEGRSTTNIIEKIIQSVKMDDS